MTPVETVLSLLKEAKPQGDGWVARCPAHEDKHPSMSISEGDDGRALVYCHAGCSTGDVISALGLTLADLMPEKPATCRPIPRQTPKTPFRPKRTFTTAEDAVADLQRRLGPCAAMWTYHDAKGERVGLVLRWNTADGKIIRPVSKRAVGWTLEGMADPRPLYRLPDLLGRKDERVYIAEGEKCADALSGVGLLPTTSPHGSKSAGKADWTPLAGRDVVIVPDNDKAGGLYAGDVADILAKLSPPATVRVVHLPDAWPDLPDGGDIADIVEEAGQDADSIKAKLEGLVDAAELLSPATSLQAGPVLVCMADVQPCEIDWLWQGRIALGRITLLIGKPGEGKSFLTTDIAARVSTATAWPDRKPCPKGSVLLISTEDGAGDTIRPRLDAHHADVDKVILLEAVRKIGKDGKLHETPFNLLDIDSLETGIKTNPDCRLVVIDPIGSYLGGGTDAHRDNEVRAVLAPVAMLAEKYGVAVLVVMHRRKAPGSTADEMAMGSQGFVGLARASWHLSRDPNDKNRRLLLPGKNNLAPEGNGLAFTIQGNPPALVWESETVDMSADDALLAENRGREDGHHPGPKPEVRNQAAAWLEELLAIGPMESKLIEAESKEAGYAWRTVQRAKDILGIKPRREQFGGKWSWELPPALGDLSCQTSQEP